MKIHPDAKVETKAIGENTRIWAGVHILAGAVIGKDCNIGEGCFIENDVIIGDGVVIKNSVALWDRIKLGNYVFVGPNAVFTNDPFPRAYPKLRTGPTGWRNTVLEEGVSIGANATIVCGVTIGTWAMVGAGALVCTDIGSHELWLGVPARKIGWACLCGRVLSSALSCQCGLNYELKSGKLFPKDQEHLRDLGLGHLSYVATEKQ